jgi:hypothetical protein
MRSITLLFAIVSLGLCVHAQCFQLAKAESKTALAPYIHDGNYNALILNEGQNAEIYKTFYADTEYRLHFSHEEVLPNIVFTVKNQDREVLFSNETDPSVKSWDFKLEKSQKLIITFKIPKDKSSSSTELKRGCISILVGFLDDEKA